MTNWSAHPGLAATDCTHSGPETTQGYGGSAISGRRSGTGAG